MSALLAAAVAGIVAALVMPPPAHAGEPGPPAITGTITAPDALPLPADALVRVWLESEPARQQPARRVAETSFAAGGRRFPIPFTLVYSATDVDPAARRYQLRALISAGKRVLFFARLGQAVTLDASRSGVGIAVEPFGGTKLEVKAIPASAGLSGEWRLTALPGAATAIPAGDAAPTLEIAAADKRITGATGCNQFFGTGVSGPKNALSLDPAGMTMKACPDPVSALESAYLAALRQTNSYRITGASLELLAGDRVLARFERRRTNAPSE